MATTLMDVALFRHFYHAPKPAQLSIRHLQDEEHGHYYLVKQYGKEKYAILRDGLCVYTPDFQSPTDYNSPAEKEQIIKLISALESHMKFG